MTLKWFESYLSHHTQRVVVSRVLSDLEPLNVKGSVLEHILFLIYVNDLGTLRHHGIIRIPNMSEHYC